MINTNEVTNENQGGNQGGVKTNNNPGGSTQTGSANSPGMSDNE
jgi:hypothetical protein